MVAGRITNVSGGSEMFRYGWVTYANEAKMTELGAPAALLEKPVGLRHFALDLVRRALQ
ncbi:MAG TPA: CinA family protein [Candidatus Methylacidiphilales bacterium]|nr:CinA family protein [Candidatus Methylacidiphilales bacterium]